MNIFRPLHIEWYKAKHSSYWWLLLGIYIAVLLLSLVNLNALIKNADVMVEGLPQLNFSFSQIMRFPDIWHNLTYLVGFFKVVPALIIITAVSREYTHRTARQNMVDGMSRNEFIVGKLYLVMLLTTLTAVLVLATGLVIGGINSTPGDVADATEEMIYLVAYIVEFFTYLCYALLLAVVVRRTGVALIFLLVVDIVLEPFIGLFLGTPLRSYLPFAVVDDLIRFPLLDMMGDSGGAGVPVQKIILAVVYAIAAVVLASLSFRRSNL